MSAESLLHCHKVGLNLGGRQILSDISMQVSAGDRIALLGPSGCGKSTLLNVLAGLLLPSVGEFRSALQPGSISIVFQEPSLLPWKNVEDNVKLLLDLGSRVESEEVLESQIHNVLARVGLWERRHAYPDQLSGGMKMRVALARALIMSPRLLLLDEPFSALDDFTREKLQDDLLQLHSTSATSFVLVTHNMEEAALLAERIIVFSPQGRIVSEIQTQDFAPHARVERDSQAVASIRAAVRSLWHQCSGESKHA